MEPGNPAIAANDPVSIPGGDADSHSHEARQALRASLFKGKGDSQSKSQDGEQYQDDPEGVAEEEGDRVESDSRTDPRTAPAEKDTPDAPADDADSATPDPAAAQELPHRKLGYKSEDDLAKALLHAKGELTRRAQHEANLRKENESLKQLFEQQKLAKNWRDLTPEEQNKLDLEAEDLGMTGKALWTIRAERAAEKAKEADDRLQYQRQANEQAEAQQAEARIQARADWVSWVESQPDYAELEEQFCKELEERPAFFKVLGQLDPDEIAEFGQHYFDLFRRAHPDREKKLREEGREEARATRPLKKLSSGAEAGRSKSAQMDGGQASKKANGKPVSAVDRMMQQRRQSEESWA